MKSKDIMLIAIVVIVSAVLSLFISQAIFGTPKNHQQEAEVVQPITAEFPKPDEKYFNGSAFDPTQQITIGQNANPDPFQNGGQ